MCLYCLFASYRGGLWETGMEDEIKCTVNDLLIELYDKAGRTKQWWLVRHTAGMLHKQVGHWAGKRK